MKKLLALLLTVTLLMSVAATASAEWVRPVQTVETWDEEADFVIWKKETGEFRCCDCEGTCINVREWLAPQYTVLGCKVFTPRKS